MSAEIARRNAARAADALADAGYVVTTVSYPPLDDEIGARHYVLIESQPFRYSAQWHLRAPRGTSFMANRGDGWEEQTAARLSQIAADSAVADVDA